MLNPTPVSIEPKVGRQYFKTSDPDVFKVYRVIYEGTISKSKLKEHIDELKDIRIETLTAEKDQPDVETMEFWNESQVGVLVEDLDAQITSEEEKLAAIEAVK